MALSFEEFKQQRLAGQIPAPAAPQGGQKPLSFEEFKQQRLAGQAPRVEAEVPKKQGFGAGVGKAFGERLGAIQEETGGRELTTGQNVLGTLGTIATGGLLDVKEGLKGQTQEEITRGMLGEKRFRKIGQAAGFLGDVAGEAISAVTPDFIKEGISSAGKAFFETEAGKKAAEALQGGAQKYEEFKKENPNVAKDLEATFNVASIFPVGKGAQAVGGGAKGVLAKTAEKAGKAAVKTADFGEKAAGRLVNTAVKTSLGDTKKAIKFGGKTLGEEMVERGFSGTDKQLFKKASELLDEGEAKLQKIIKDSPDKIRREEIIPDFHELRTQFAETPGAGNKAAEIDKLLAEVPEEMTLSKANQIKRNIYEELGDTAYKVDASLSGKKEAMQKLASSLMRKIEEKAISPDVRAINKELGVGIRMKDALIDNFARKEKNNILGLGSLGTIGAGGLAGGIPGAIAAAGGRALLGSTVAKTTGAKALSKAAKVLRKLGKQGGKLTIKQPVKKKNVGGLLTIVRPQEE